MFVRHIFDVKHAVVEGSNTVSVMFTAASTYATARANAYPYVVPFTHYVNELANRNFVRKAQVCSVSVRVS